VVGLQKGVHSIHSLPPELGKAGKPNAEAAAQSSGKNRRKKKVGSNNKSLAGAPTTAIAAVATGRCCGPRGFGSDEGGPWCPVHNSRRHSAEECQDIKKFTEQFREKQKQQP
jgi:hypothetical protein